MFAQWIVNASVATDSGSSLYATYNLLFSLDANRSISCLKRRVRRDCESEVILSNHSVWLWFCLDSRSACILPFPAMCPAGVCLNVAGRDSRVEVAGAGAGKGRG